ncbi:MAG: hypothetical protein MJZ82_02130 [Paludibacteraceae bacterium]|nr:hypothetical protein [Paludibacteraceae bacterium]
MRWSQILLIVGLVVLLCGAVMTFTRWSGYADYVLVAGAVIVIFRGAIRARERNDENASRQ